MKILYLVVILFMLPPVLVFAQHTTYLTGNFEYAERQRDRHERSRAEQFVFSIDFSRLYQVAGIEIGPRIIVDVTSNNRFFPVFGSGSVFLVGQKSFLTSFDPTLEMLLRTDVGFTGQEDAFPSLMQSPFASVLNGVSASASVGVQKSLDKRMILFAFLGYRAMNGERALNSAYVLPETRGLEFSVGFGWRSK